MRLSIGLQAKPGIWGLMVWERVALPPPSLGRLLNSALLGEAGVNDTCMGGADRAE